MDRSKPPMPFGRCKHRSPVVVDELEGGKKIARCLACGEIGPVREGTQEALQALRDRVRQGNPPSTE